MANIKFKLNPKLRISPFDGNHGNELLYETVDAQGHDRRFTITETVHKLLLSFRTANSLDAVLAMTENNLKKEEVHAFKKLVEGYFLPNNVLIKEDEVNLTLQPQKRRKPTYMILKFTLLAPQVVKCVSSPFLFLFKIKWGITALTLFALSQALIYFPVSSSFIKAPITQASDISVSSTELLGSIFFAFLGLLFHEIGHAAAAVRYRCKKVDIGMGLYICFIVFYADLSEIWRLNRRQRLLVDLGGIYFQMIFMVIISFFYFLTSNHSLYLANVVLTISLLWNLNPFFRLDGYWIASDLFGFDNLRAAANSTSVLNRNTNPRNKLLASHREQTGHKRKLLLVYALLSKFAFLGLIYWFSFYVLGDILTGLPTKLGDLDKSASLSDFLVALGGLAWTALMFIFIGYLAVRLTKTTYSIACKISSYFREILCKRKRSDTA